MTNYMFVYLLEHILFGISLTNQTCLWQWVGGFTYIYILKTVLCISLTRAAL